MNKPLTADQLTTALAQARTFNAAEHIRSCELALDATQTERTRRLNNLFIARWVAMWVD